MLSGAIILIGPWVIVITIKGHRGLFFGQDSQEVTAAWMKWNGPLNVHEAPLQQHGHHSNNNLSCIEV